MGHTFELDDIQRLNVRKGETLVVRVPTRNTAEIERVRDGLCAALPDVKVLVIGPDVELSVLCPGL